MQKYTIVGGRKLEGEVRIDGAKNSVLPILAATILNAGVTVLQNCPDIRDVHITLEILRSLGCTAFFEDGTVIVDATTITSDTVPAHLAGKLRSSVLFMGALLTRCGQVTIAYPGECVVQFPRSILPECRKSEGRTDYGETIAGRRQQYYEQGVLRNAGQLYEELGGPLYRGRVRVLKYIG